MSEKGRKEKSEWREPGRMRLSLLPEQQATIVVLSNTSGAMQFVSDITIKLFDTAVDSKN